VADRCVPCRRVRWGVAGFVLQLVVKCEIGQVGVWQGLAGCGRVWRVVL
jgi:hypothetical protein